MTPPMREAWHKRRKQMQPAGMVSGGCGFLLRLMGSNIVGGGAAVVVAAV